MTIEGVDSPTENVIAPQEAPTLTAEQVRKVVQREKAEAAEKAKREMQAQYEAEMAQYRSSQPQTIGGLQQSGMDEEKLYSQFKNRLMQEHQQNQEEARVAEHQRHLNEVAGNYLSKMARGKDLYPDFDSMTADFEPEAFAPLVILASRMDNLPDIIYDLSQNSSKLTSLNQLAEKSPRMAERELQKLSDSIRQNQMAKQNNKSASPPLNRLQPSASAGADSGAVTISDFKKMPWLKA